MRTPSLDGQGDLEEVNQVLVGERTEMGGVGWEVMEDGLENPRGGLGEAEQAFQDVLKIWVLATEGLPWSSLRSCAYWATCLMPRVSNVHPS